LNSSCTLLPTIRTAQRCLPLPDTLATDERLLKIVVKSFQHGETNKIRLANRAIAKFEAQFEAKAVA